MFFGKINMKMFQVVVGGKFNLQVNLIFNYKGSAHTFFNMQIQLYIIRCGEGLPSEEKVFLSEQWYRVLTNAFLFLVVI